MADIIGLGGSPPATPGAQAAATPVPRAAEAAQAAQAVRAAQAVPAGWAGDTGAAGASTTTEQALEAVIAERVREFRLHLGLTVGQLAERSGMSKGMLSKIENAQASPSLATLARLSDALAVPVTAFFRGLNEEQDVVHVPAGKGLDIQHKGSGPGHRYQSLGTMPAPHSTLEPLLVTLTERADTFPLYQHAGTEIVYVLSGRIEYGYGSSRYLLDPGDAIQFVGEVPHGPSALIELPIQFLAIKSIVGGSIPAGG